MVRTTRRGYFGVLALLAAVALLCVLTSSSVASPGATTHVSVDSSGTQANARSTLSVVSADGRYVAFASNATNLVPGDTNGRTDIFVRDLQTGTTERVSVNSFEAQANGNSPNLNNGGGLPSISADGRYVAFISDATNLVPGDTNGRTDAFVRDLQAGTTELASVSSSGAQANDFSQDPSISADGRYVTFTSDATNLVPGDTTGLGLGRDVFVRDLQAGTTERVSVSSSGTEANGNTFTPSISADGRYVAFASSATNLVASDNNGGIFDAFMHDRQTGTTQLVSVNGCPTPAQALTGSGSSSVISADGRYVAFSSDATNLVADDTNEVSDVLVRDLQAGTTQRVSVGSSGAQADGGSGGFSISANGSHVAFASSATNLVAGDTNGVIDIFVHERRETATQPDDCVAPTTAASATTDSGALYEPDAWTNENVEVTFSAQDNEGGSGIGPNDVYPHSGIRYSASGAQSISETVYDPENPPVINTEGTTTIKYFATDNMGNRKTPANTLTVKIDKAPPTANVSINGGDDFTNNTAVNLTLSDEPEPGAGVTQMRFSNDGTSWSEWEPFATSKEWVVSEGDGEKTVHVQFKDAAGNESATAQDSIVLDQTAPVVASTSPFKNQTGVPATANISATFAESGSGIDPDSLYNDSIQVVQVKPTGDVRVSGLIAYEESTATFYPSQRLAKGLYRAIITTGVKDRAGNALSKDYTWTFATAGPSKK